MFFKRGVLKNFAVFTGLQACNFIKKRLQHRCFSVNIAKFLRTSFFTDHLWRLLLKGEKRNYSRLFKRNNRHLKPKLLFIFCFCICCYNYCRHSFIDFRQSEELHSSRKIPKTKMLECNTNSIQYHDFRRVIIYSSSAIKTVQQSSVNIYDRAF